MEIESLEAKAQIKNEFDQGYDDCINNKPAMLNASDQYNEGYGFAYTLGEKQSVGNN
jgi:hypothetical protein